MHESGENRVIDQLIDELKQTTNRMNELTQIMVQSGLETDRLRLEPGVTGSLRGLLEALGDDADTIERLVERLNPELYLEWLFSVPADSNVFEYRRRYSDQREEEFSN